MYNSPSTRFAGTGGPAQLGRRGRSMKTRRALAVSGVVQGVGFRPFVHELAERLGLGGFVLNQAGGVWIEVEGEAEALDRFLTELTTRPPPLGRITAIRATPAPLVGESNFRIESSERGPAGPIFLPPD